MSTVDIVCTGGMYREEEEICLKQLAYVCVCVCVCSCVHCVCVCVCVCVCDYVVSFKAALEAATACPQTLATGA